MKKIGTLVVILLALVVAISQTSAGVIARYTFVDQSLEDQANTGNVIAQDFTGGVDNMLQFGSAEKTSDTHSLFIRNSQLSAESEAASIEDDFYWSFEVKPAGGYWLNLEELVFDFRRDGAGTAYYSVYSSVDSFASSLSTGQAAYGDGWQKQTVDLSESSFQGLSDATEFRIYVWKPEGDGSTTGRITRGDTFELTGTIIPEPGTLVLLGLAGLALLKRRRV